MDGRDASPGFDRPRIASGGDEVLTIALVGLGYDLAAAEAMLAATAREGEDQQPEELIAAALRAAATKGH